MINLVERTIEIQPGVVEKIIRFDVWWLTPWGIMGDLEMAINHCVANDVDPNKCLQAVPVGITENTYEVPINQIN